MLERENEDYLDGDYRQDAAYTYPAQVSILTKTFSVKKR
jgi:hypothetical protein